jgi:hypothetical protein
MDDVASLSGLNQRLGMLSLMPPISATAPWDGIAKPDVRVFGLWETMPCCRFSCSKDNWFVDQRHVIEKRARLLFSFISARKKFKMSSTCCICMSLSEGRDMFGEVAEDDQGGVLLSPS